MLFNLKLLLKRHGKKKNYTKRPHLIVLTGISG